VTNISLLLVTAFFVGISAGSKSSEKIVRVYADHNNDTHIVLQDAKEAVVRHKPDQQGIEQVKIDDHHQTAGWLILYPDPNSSSTYRFADTPGSLVIWRNGKIVRTFEPGQTLWSWSFVEGADEVAYHSGPPHGERSSHCELRDVTTGRLLASWDGDLGQVDRPEWTKRLDH
jgi:hypothetical protein